MSFRAATMLRHDASSSIFTRALPHGHRAFPHIRPCAILHMHVVRLFHAVRYNTSAQPKPWANF